MSIEDTRIESLAKKIQELPDNVRGKKDWLKGYFDGNAEQLKEAHNRLVEELVDLQLEKKVSSEAIRGIRLNEYNQLETTADGEHWAVIAGTGQEGTPDAIYYLNGKIGPTVNLSAGDVGALDKARYDRDGDGMIDEARSAKNGDWLYTAVFPLTGWAADTTKTGYGFSQTVNVSPVDGGPAFTAGTGTFAPMVNLTGNADEDERLLEDLAIISRGYKEPQNGSIKVYLKEKPQNVNSLQIYMRGREYG